MVNTPRFPVEGLSNPMASSGEEIEFSYAVMINNENKFSHQLLEHFLYLNFFIENFLMCMAIILKRCDFWPKIATNHEKILSLHAFR